MVWEFPGFLEVRRGVSEMTNSERAHVDREIERLAQCIELGGYIPCPDHRIPTGAKWDNVKYYCEKMRERF
jgi:hypothetical protein